MAPPVTNHRYLTTNNYPQVHIADKTFCNQPTVTKRLQPTAGNQLPATNCQQPTANNQPLATNSQQLTVEK